MIYFYFFMNTFLLYLGENPEPVFFMCPQLNNATIHGNFSGWKPIVTPQKQNWSHLVMYSFEVNCNWTSYVNDYSR
ncbi:hypothetical protein GDO81_018864 [Engystomops pustulosus]|uniref:AMP-activated protein kinase glycogen-binding domain-containing protein n=1 Tax=Engystomops pustulosus TaxID=76066 RepID=A0AAV6ZGB6_ENGPU|nr:hypothetical protein GDO81_018864 [Engystomops pustulosus]